MLSATLLGLLALVAGSQASFIIPADLEDGFHSFTISNGTQVHQKIADHIPAPKDWMNKHAQSGNFNGPAGHVRRDDNSDPQCESVGVGIDQNDLGQAQYQLDTGCDAGWKASSKGAAIGVKGDVITFFCNYASSAKGCSSYNLDRDISAAWKACKGEPGEPTHTSVPSPCTDQASRMGKSSRAVDDLRVQTKAICV